MSMLYKRRKGEEKEDEANVTVPTVGVLVWKFGVVRRTDEQINKTLV